MKKEHFIAGGLGIIMSSALFAMAAKPTESESIEKGMPKITQAASSAESLSDEKKIALSSEQLQQDEKSLQVTLESHRWQLIDAKAEDGTSIPEIHNLISENKPNVELRFFDGRVNARNTCNQQMANYSIDDKTKITFGPVAQNMRACVSTEMAIRDDSIISILSTVQSPQLDNGSKNPLMVLVDKSNRQFTFKGTITPEAFFNQVGKEMFFQVKPKIEQCTLTGLEGKHCLLMREIQYDSSFRKTIPDETWHEVPASNVADFNLEEGFYHIIRVKRFEFDEKNQSLELPFEGVSPLTPFYVLELVVEMSESGQQ